MDCREIWSATAGRVAVLCLLALAVLVTVSCTKDEAAEHPDNARQPLILTRGLSGQPGSLDPQRAEDAFSYDVLRDLYEGLTASTPDGEVIPAAATSWRVESDGRVYVFLLRREARWSNGDPVTAANYVEAFRRALDPATASGAADLLRSIENAPAILQGECPRDRLVSAQSTTTRSKFAFLMQLPYFPDILTNTVASPVHPTSVSRIGRIFKAGCDDF